MLLAYVRYADGECGIMPCSLIKDFTPAHVADYKKGETKKAFWFRKRDGHMQGYYDAEIKALAEDMGSLLQELNRQRLPVPGNDFVFDQGDVKQQLVTGTTERRAGVTRKEAVKNTRTAKNLQLKTILGKRKEASDVSAASAAEKIKSLRVENDRLKADLEACKEKLLCEEQEKKKYANMAHDLTRTLLEKIDVLFASTNAPSSTFLGSCRDRATQPVPTASAPPDPSAASTPSTCRESYEAAEHLECDQEPESIPLFATIDNEVHLGNNIFISSQKFTWILKSKSDAMFVKDMARALWDVSVLMNRSVTGVVCPRFAKDGAVAKPALTPQKLQAVSHAFSRYTEEKPSAEVPPQVRAKQINKHLANFLRDLRRK